MLINTKFLIKGGVNDSFNWMVKEKIQKNLKLRKSV